MGFGVLGVELEDSAQGLFALFSESTFDLEYPEIKQNARVLRETRRSGRGPPPGRPRSLHLGSATARVHASKEADSTLISSPPREEAGASVFGPGACVGT